MNRGPYFTTNCLIQIHSKWSYKNLKIKNRFMKKTCFTIDLVYLNIWWYINDLYIFIFANLGEKGFNLIWGDLRTSSSFSLTSLCCITNCYIIHVYKPNTQLSKLMIHIMSVIHRTIKILREFYYLLHYLFMKQSCKNHVILVRWILQLSHHS